MSERMEALNAAQRLAVTTTEGPVLIIAGPGTGKTRTLVERVRYLLTERRVPPEAITVTTFTKKAAAELLTRISLSLEEESLRAAAGRLHLGNFHHLARVILDRSPTTLGRTGQYRVLAEAEALALVRAGWAQWTRWPAFTRRFGERPRSVYSLRSVLRLFDQLREGQIDASSTEEDTRAAWAWLDLYEQQLRDHNAVDFSGLLFGAVQILEQEEAVRRHFQQQCRYLLVDEYQDTNPVQEQLLQILSAPTRNLCVVGDDDQSLYRFRGATVENLLHFPERYPETKLIRLEENYRSDGGILRMASQFLNAYYYDLTEEEEAHCLRQHRYEKHLVSAVHRDHAGSVETLLETTQARWVDAVVAKVQDLGKALGHYRDIAVLAYSVYSEEVQALVKGLREADVPLEMEREPSLLSDPDVKRLISCYWAVWSPFLRARVQTQEQNEIFGAWHQQWEALPKQGQAARIQCGKQLRARLSEGLDPLQVGYEFFACPPFFRRLHGALTGERVVVVQRLAAFLAQLQAFCDMQGFSRVHEEEAADFAAQLFFDYLPLLEKSRQSAEIEREGARPDAVRVMTIHQSKGLEFPVVFFVETPEPKRRYVEDPLLGFAPSEEGKHRLPETVAARFDVARRNYTAFTRAKDRLILTGIDPVAAQDFSMKEGNRHPDPPLMALNTTLPSARAEEAHTRRPSAKEIPPQASYAYTTDIAPYRRCPRQYFFFRRLGFPQPHRAAAAYGTLVHGVLETLHRTGEEWGEERLREEILRTAQGLWRMGLPLSEDAPERAQRELSAYGKQGTALRQQAQTSELFLRYAADGCFLEGTIDLLLRDGRLVDFKTGQEPEEGEATMEGYRGQIAFYRLLLQRSGAPEGAGCPDLPDLLYFTGSQTPVHEVAVQEADCEALEAEILAQVRAIEAGAFSARAASETTCTACPMRPFCEEDRRRAEAGGAVR